MCVACGPVLACVRLGGAVLSCRRPTAVLGPFSRRFRVVARCLSWRGVAWRGLVTAKDVDADGGRRTDPTPGTEDLL